MIKSKHVWKKIVEKDGKKYVVKNCPFCGTELLFLKRDFKIRLYAKCNHCGKKLEMEI